MATLKSIVVTECDNELIGIVVPSGPTSSLELFHFKLGDGAPINYTVPIEGNNVLPSGNYTLFLIGINWAGPAPNPANFTVTVNYMGTPPKVLTYSNPGPTAGVVWTPAGVPFTV